MISRFFIDRPVFASVVSVIITLIGFVTLLNLPIDRYPEITPPTVRVTAQYLGANAEVVEQTVAAPIEQQLNGVENMLYFDSKSTNDGRLTVTVTFEVGTDLDIAAVQVQNRVALAEPQLPEEVRRQGISVRKQSTSLLLALAVESPGNSYDGLFLSNYAKINVRDRLARIYGVGDVQLPGERDYGMRIWLNPDSLFKLGLTTGDVIASIREQNVQAAAGRIGQSPAARGQEVEYTIRTEGRLKNPEEFQNIILRSNSDGSSVRVRDVARVELGAFDYTMFTRYNGKEAVILLVYQLPGSNAVDVARKVQAEIEAASASFPQDVRYRKVYDSTNFVRASINEVMRTLLEAVALVILVVFLFLQSWRATLIPLITVPVSLLGAFSFFPLLGFSVNVLTLFGLVLAIGIVVDDAIVVVEAVEHHIAQGLSPRDASIKAMEEVSGAVVAIALILVAVFVPVAFQSGITGQLYRQFALTIAVSVVLSAINALTLSPPLCALLLRKHDGHSRSIVFRGFNAAFDRTLGVYSRIVRTLIRRGAIVAALLLATLGATWQLYRITPTGFLPTEDEGWFIVDVALPSGASLERTSRVLEEADKIVRSTPGVANVISLGGTSFVKGDTASSVGGLICILKPWDERKKPEEQALAIAGALQRRLFALEGAFILVFNPPPISGLGNTGGLNMKLQDRSGGSIADLARVTGTFLAAARDEPALGQLVSTFVPNEPQLRLEVDRERARSMGVLVNDVYQTMQTYLGGLYVNDFNLFGRTYRVVAQAAQEYRRDPRDISHYYVRSRTGNMIPLSVLVKTEPTNGPLSIGRYNLFRSADILGGAAPGYSTGQALEAAERLAARTLPPGFGYEWTTMSYQEKRAGSNAGVFALALLMVVLLLAAQYESWIIPIAVVLGVPAGVFGAILTEWFRGIPDDVYCRIGLIMLIGLAAKNAILIVEFARQRREAGVTVAEAALEAAQLRFRPILMTSFAFILGVVPLVTASGAGSASRRSLGSAVFGGMIVATILGVFMIPTFYVWFQKLADRVSRPGRALAPQVAMLMLAAFGLQGCLMGPNYKAPALPVPEHIRNAAPGDATSAGDLEWAGLFHDPVLQSLLREGLERNYDLAIAARNILDARSQVDIVRSGQFPVVSGRGNLTNREISAGGGTALPPGFQRETTFGGSLLDMTFQLDFWGRYRRQTESARNELLGQEWARRTVAVSLIAEIATAYFQLIEVDRELAISRQTLGLRRESLRLVQAREARGVASGLDVSQAENLVFTASARVPVLERQANILENALSVLLARNPGPIANRGELPGQQIPSDLPAGLPGDLLRRRPDLQQAEAALRAANARIGVAKASLYPQFFLTGLAGFESVTLEKFISDRTRQYQVGPGFTVPLFNAGALRANVRSAQARAEVAAISYERSFQGALREAADGLIGVQKIREQRTEQEQLLRALREAARLSRLLYQGGVTSYLQVLDADRNLFDAELVFAQIQRDELLSVVRLYRALGGGWRSP